MEDDFSGASIVDFPGLQKRLSEEAAEWLSDKRKIKWSTAGKMPVASGTVYFPDLGRKADAIFFRYEGGWKARAWPDKAFTQKQGTKAQFWNLAAVLNGKLKDVYVVEGELDALSLIEAGISPEDVLSAPSASSGEHAYAGDALARGLGKAKRFIWCGDQDEAGLRLRAEMAAILGLGKFYFVNWPEGCKDANDYLCSDGPEALHEMVTKGFLPWPIEGMYRLSEIPDRPPLLAWNTGFALWDGKVAIAPGTLSVVVGHPGHGKTALWTQIFAQVVQQYGIVVATASFETMPKPHIQRQLRRFITNKQFVDMNDHDLRVADQWINEHYLFLLHPERRPTLTWLMIQAEMAVTRHNAKVIQIDPWNRLEAAKENRESETDYVGRCLRELYNFAVDFNVHVQIIVHPAKMDGYRRGRPPELEDCSGSKHWENMCDQGSTIHRPKLFDEEGNRETYAEFYHRKARFDELGYSTKFGLDYDVEMGKFYSCALRKRGRKKDNGEPDE